MHSRKYINIFILAFICRFAWMLFSGLDYTDGADYSRYERISNLLLQGDVDPTTEIFILAPLFPLFSSICKFITPGGYWPITLQLLQISLSSLSVVYLSRTAYIIFKTTSVAIITGILYSFLFPFYYWSHLASQESIFQSLFIFAIYHITKYASTLNTRSLVLFATFYTLSILTKSHVAVLLPGFLFIIFIKQPTLSRKIIHSIVVLSLIFIINLPYGLFTLFKYNSFVLSSNGSGAYFYFGHNEGFYEYIAETPPLNSPRFLELQSMDFPSMSIDNIESFEYGERQKILFNRGLEWSAQNPAKLAHLFIYNLVNHLRPGYAFRFRPLDYKIILVNFIMFSIYLPAYIEIYRSIPKWKFHLPMLIIVFAMLLFSLIFYSQNRFRNITVDPIYLIYASPLISSNISNLIKLFSIKKHKLKPQLPQLR